MQALARLILGILSVVIFFWIFGFWWGIGVIAAYALIEVANWKGR